MGRPIHYKLLPVSLLSLFCNVENDMSTQLPSQECFMNFVQLFDDFRKSRQQIERHQLGMAKNRLCLAPDQLQIPRDCLKNLTEAEQSLKKSYTAVLSDVRKETCGSEKLSRLHATSSKGSHSPTSIVALLKDHGEKVALFSSMTSRGVTYIGYNGLDLQTELNNHGRRDAYVLFFSEQAIRDSETWTANKSLMLHLLQTAQQGSFFAIVDCDATDTA
jgi:hypothetical protein